MWGRTWLCAETLSNYLFRPEDSHSYLVQHTDIGPKVTLLLVIESSLMLVVVHTPILLSLLFLEDVF